MTASGRRACGRVALGQGFADSGAIPGWVPRCGSTIGPVGLLRQNGWPRCQLTEPGQSGASYARLRPRPDDGTVSTDPTLRTYIVLAESDRRMSGDVGCRNVGRGDMGRGDSVESQDIGDRCLGTSATRFGGVEGSSGHHRGARSGPAGGGGRCRVRGAPVVGVPAVGSVPGRGGCGVRAAVPAAEDQPDRGAAAGGRRRPGGAGPADPGRS